MKKINLKRYYDHITTDTYYDVPDEIYERKLTREQIHAAIATLSDMLDMWMDEELNPSKRSNGTAHSYINISNRVKQHAIDKRKLKTITAEHLQKFFDLLSSPQPLSNGKYSKGLSAGTLNVYAAVMRGA